MPPLSATDSLHLFRTGHPADALPHLQHAHREDPSNLTVLHALASALQRTGQANAAVDAYRDAAAVLPDNAGLFEGWARASLLVGDRAQAMLLLRRALTVDPRHVESVVSLGTLLRESDQPDVACDVLGHYVAHFPAHAELVWEYARSLWAADRLAESEQQFELHRTLRPQYSRSRVALGRLSASRGDTGSACRWFREALQLAPDDAAAWWELAHADPDAMDEPSLQKVREFASTAPHPEQRELFEDILARHADRSGRYADAILHAKNATRLRIQSSGSHRNDYDAAGHAGEIDAIIATYTPPLFLKFSGAGAASPKPVFIIGLPRSGTTLLERMLDAHPHISGVGEQRLARRALQLAMAESRSDIPGITRNALQDAATWHLLELDRREQLLAPEAHASRIVDKLPDNYLLAGWLALSLPHATVIHCQRDPRDVALSCWLGRFAEMPWSHDIEHIVARIEQHRRLMRHWREVLPRRPCEVAYEDLVARPADVVGGVLAVMGLEWDDAVLEFATGNGAVKSASQMQVRQPLNARSIGRWRHYAEMLAPAMPRLDKIVADDAQEGTAPRFS